MNNRNELLHNFKEMQIGLDESFTFHCTQCGKCCIHRDDILLTAKDVFRIARKFQVSPKELIEQYCETYIGRDSRLPVVRLKPSGRVQRCPLLKDRKCSVHDVKPYVCAMFPIGRGLSIQEGKTEHLSKTEIKYIFVNPGCGDDTEQHTVREWFNRFQIPLEDEFFVSWSKAMISLSKCLKSIEKNTTEKAMSAIYNALFAGLYLNYDMADDFDSQVQINLESSVQFLQSLSEFNKSVMTPEST